MLIKWTGLKSRGAHSRWRLAFHCVNTVDFVCQATRQLIQLHPIDIVRAIRRRGTFNLLRKYDGIRVTGGRPEVPSGDKSSALFNEIVLTFNSDVEFVFHQLHQARFQRVGARASRPSVEGIILDGRELWPTIEARNIEQLSNSTNRTTGSTACQLNFKYIRMDSPKSAGRRVASIILHAHTQQDMVWSGGQRIE